MKCTVTLALLFVAFLVAAVNCQRHNAAWGAHDRYDYKLREGHAAKKSAVLRIVSTDFYFNQTHVHYPRNITLIKVTDLYTNGKGGYATLVSGGPRTTHAKIHFKSQRGHGFAFLIDIYGH